MVNRKKIILKLTTLLLVTPCLWAKNDPINSAIRSQETVTNHLLKNTKLLPPQAGIGGDNSQLGSGVDIQGNRALVGAAGMGPKGRVFVLDFDGSQWQESAVLIPAEDVSNCGRSVSLSHDRALFSCNQGAYLYEFDGVTWSGEQLNTNPIELGYGLGSSFVSLEGDLAVIGVRRPSSQAYIGEVLVYELVNQNWTLSQTLHASDSQQFNDFGISVGISNNKILVGASGQGESGLLPGASYLFEHNGMNWEETTVITGSDSLPNDAFGVAVSIKNDRIVVYAQKPSGDLNRIYVYDFNGQNWLETTQLSHGGQILTNIGLAEDQIVMASLNNSFSAVTYQFNGAIWTGPTLLSPVPNDAGRAGWSVATSGNHILVGDLDSGAEQHSYLAGSAYFYQPSGGSWVVDQQFTKAGSSWDLMGQSIDLSANWALVGAPGDDEVQSSSGAAYIYQLSNDTVLQTQKLVITDAVEDESLGVTVALDDQTAMVASYGSDPNTGAVYVFNNDTNVWSLTQKLTPGDGVLFRQFGTTISFDANLALISNDQGDVYAFVHDGNDWIETQKLTKLAVNFGTSIAIDGQTALISAELEDAVYVYEFDGNDWLEQARLKADDAQTFLSFGTSVSLGADLALIGAAKDDEAGTAAGAVYVFENTGGMWQQTQKLLPNDPQANAGFGAKVVLDNDQAAIGTDLDLAEVYLYELINTQFVQRQKIVSKSQGVNNLFDGSIGLKGDRLLIGAPGDADHGNNAGAAILYTPGPDLIFGHGFEAVNNN